MASKLKTQASPGLGWAAGSPQAEGQFRGTFNVFAFDPAPVFQGTGEIRFKGRVRGDSLSGEFVFDVFDPPGNLVPGAGGHGTISGKRFQVKPL